MDLNYGEEFSYQFESNMESLYHRMLTSCIKHSMIKGFIIKILYNIPILNNISLRKYVGSTFKTHNIIFVEFWIK